MIIERLFKAKDPRLLLIAGPCVIEDYDMTFNIAAHLRKLSLYFGIPFLFKASYDKANRSSFHSYRGPGHKEGLKILSCIRQELEIEVMSDVHRISEIEEAAEVLDVIQIPAFLSRQTDLIIEVAKTFTPINVKKGQFAAPMDMVNTVLKMESVGAKYIMLTERGTCFGYHDLVVDMRSIPIMKESTGCPVIFDATHSVQTPGSRGETSGGKVEFAPVLAKAAVAAGADGVFIETHPQPDKALCDGPNSIALKDMHGLIRELLKLRGE